jgi:hypothetical protein
VVTACVGLLPPPVIAAAGAVRHSRPAHSAEAQVPVADAL